MGGMTRQLRRQILIRASAIAAAVALAPQLSSAQSPPAGEQIFSAQCVRCHGTAGQGAGENRTALVGDLSVDQLAAVIGETMPEDDPGTLSADESQAVAAYIHDAFYSPIARARNQPARIELARLTVRQYRHAVADLIGSFGAQPAWGDERGLTGEYFAHREPQGRDQAKVVRTDAGVDFDFKTEAPVPEIEEPRVFSMRWTGSVLAPETGPFEFIIRTNHAARLWVNGGRDPLIDVWVKSGEDTEFAANQYLVGGRLYSVKLEFTKAKVGVDDSDKQKEKPPSAPAFIGLYWRRPNGPAEPITARLMTRGEAPEAYVCTTPFPPDDRSYGWERGTAVSQAWDEATTNAAIETAEYVGKHVDRLAGTHAGAEDRVVKLREFSATLAERAFRRPLDDESRALYVDQQFADFADDPDAAVQRCVLLVLKSPRFLFREVGGNGGDSGAAAFETAARLAFGLWNSVPDESLWNAARGGELGSDDGVRKQVERMLGDLRARAKLQEFLLTWLHLDVGADLTKDASAFPEFDAAAIADARSSLEMLLAETVDSPEADYRRLLLGDEVYLNERLAGLYHAELPEGIGFRKTRLDEGARAGVLTHPYVMARFAYASESSPIHRGVFLARGVLGRTLRPPPDAFAPLPPDLHPDLTTRERVTLQTKATECMTCHQIINPLGFALERFDAIGRYRETDRGKEIDAAATYETPGGERLELNGARELAEFLAGSHESHAAFVEQLFHHLVGQPVAAYGPETLERLVQSFAAHDYNIRSLAAEIMATTARVGREPAAESQAAESATAPASD
jgi:mono/diheme cytochrome c family protein